MRQPGFTRLADAASSGNVSTSIPALSSVVRNIVSLMDRTRALENDTVGDDDVEERDKPTDNPIPSKHSASTHKPPMAAPF